MDLLINSRAVEIYAGKIETAKNAKILLGGVPSNDKFLFVVKLFKDQAIVAFPKYSSCIAIGFYQEDDGYDTNLPYQCKAEEIYEHIKCNKKYKEIKKKDCIKAIEKIQTACRVLNILIKQK
jgi:hypothetical protein